MSEENVTALKVGTGIAPVLPNVRFPRRWKFGRAVHTKTPFRRQYSTAAGRWQADMPRRHTFEGKERAGMGKRKQEPIIVKAYVKTADGGEVDVDTLGDEQREKLGTWLRVTYLNELCRGKAKFHVKQ